MRRFFELCICQFSLLTTAVAHAECVKTWQTFGIDHSIFAMTTWDPDGPGPLGEVLVVGGLFSQFGGVPANNIAYWDGVDWHALGDGTDGAIFALTVYHGDLIATGNFSHAGESLASRIARFDGATWHSLGSGMSGGDWFGTLEGHALAVYQDDLIAGGIFRYAGDSTVHSIARWDGQEWHDLEGGLDFHSSTDAAPVALAFVVLNGSLFVGGSFERAGEIPVHNIARWDGSSWYSMGGVFAGNSLVWVKKLSSFKGELFASGNFTQAGNVSANHIAAWNGDTWHSLGNGIDSGSIGGFALYDGKLAVGGVAMAGGMTVSNIACWDGMQWCGYGSGTPHWIGTLAVYSGALYASGYEYLSKWSSTNLFGDFNNSNHVELSDYLGLMGCATDPAAPDTQALASADCLCVFNADGDADIDLKDFQQFQNGFGAD